MTPRRISDIAAELAALTDDDPEASHLRADELLIEAIDRLSAYATETVDESESDHLICAFRRITKWYA